MIGEVRGAVGRLRDSHHRIAQMMAMGWTDSQIRRVTGITHHRLALYRADPAMQDVIAKYSKAGESELEQFGDFFRELMSNNGLKAELYISDKLDDALDGEAELSLTVADRISQGRADRTGYGKTSRIEHMHDFATRLENAIERSGKAVALPPKPEIKVIEGQVSNASPGVSHSHVKAPDPRPTAPAELRLPVPVAEAREMEPVRRTAPEPPNFGKVLKAIKRRRLA